MDKISLGRRQMLFYLGLGTASAGVATASGLLSKIAPSQSSTQSSVGQIGQAQNAAIAAHPESAAQPSSAKQLPEFQGISQWLNSPPLTRSTLNGSVVLIQFWTFACINCQRTLPYITRWHRQYAAKGLKVVGIHTPEFAFERDVNNVKKALQQNQITYAVPLDNEFKTWKAYSNQYWPHLFLADRQGILRYDHIGEGAYDTTEQTIQRLLG